MADQTEPGAEKSLGNSTTTTDAPSQDVAKENSQYQHSGPAQSSGSGIAARVDKKEWIIFPKDGKNKDQNSQTEKSLKEISQSEDVNPYIDSSGRLAMWLVEVDDDQLQRIKGLPGVGNAEFNEMMVEAVLSPSTTAQSSESVPDISDIAARDDKKEWIIFPWDSMNIIQNSQTEKSLREISKPEEVYPSVDSDNGEVSMWLVNVNDDQLKVIQKLDGVKTAEFNRLDTFEAVPSPSATVPLFEWVPNKVKRAIEYTSQPKAPYKLVMVSRPKDRPLDKFENYVYETHAGKDVYIYHVEEGISAQSTDEFPKDQVEFLQTQRSKDAKQDVHEDGSRDPDGHSTCTASKAMSKTYGTAKKATLVVVKMKGLVTFETADVFNFVWKDIKKNNRQGKSIVTFSVSSGTREDLNNLPEYRKTQRKYLNKLLLNGVIVVCSAGNHAQEEYDSPEGKRKREEVDTTPALFETSDNGLIVVGNVDSTGAKEYRSQSGSHVTIHAPGTNIMCQDRQNQGKAQTRTGTSFSAPLVAGVLANFLAYERPPFSTEPRKIVKEAKKYLINTANWERAKGIKTIWNLVTEAVNPPKGSEAPKESPPPNTSPTNVVQIVWNSEAYQDAVSGYSQWWIFGYHSGDPKPDVCKRAGFVYADNKIKVANIPFPDGTFDFPFEILGKKDCKYMGKADEPGQLSCPGFPNPVDCKEDPDQGKLFGTCYDPQGTDTLYNKVRCEW